MSINISDIIEVNLSISPNTLGVGEFGPLLFLTDKKIPSTGKQLISKSYNSLQEVLEDFKEGSIVKAATAWYGQKPKPLTFIVGTLEATSDEPSTPAKIIGSKDITLDDIKQVKDGDLELNISGNIVFIKNVDFSEFENVNDVPSVLESSINKGRPRPIIDITIKENKIVLTTLEGGKEQFISVIGGTLDNVLGLSTGQNTSGVDGKGVSSSIKKIEEETPNFYMVGLDEKLRGNLQITIAKHIETQEKIFGLESSDRAIIQPNSENIFKTVKELNLQNTLMVYDKTGEEYPAISIMARASTVNFNTRNGSIILAYKQGPGVSTVNVSSYQLKNIQNYNGNAFISVGDRQIFWDGRMANGYWFDTVQGVHWLLAQLRTNLFNLFYTSTTKIPWTDVGVSMVVQAITNGLELGITNGVIAPGYDNEGTFYPDGYKIYSTPISQLASQKGKRIWEGTSFIAIGSGAIQGVKISGTFIQ